MRCPASRFLVKKIWVFFHRLPIFYFILKISSVLRKSTCAKCPPSSARRCRQWLFFSRTITKRWGGRVDLTRGGLCRDALVSPACTSMKPPLRCRWSQVKELYLSAVVHHLRIISEVEQQRLVRIFLSRLFPVILSSPFWLLCQLLPQNRVVPFTCRSSYQSVIQKNNRPPSLRPLPYCLCAFQGPPHAPNTVYQPGYVWGLRLLVASRVYFWS